MDVWAYSFTLLRECEQASLNLALRHPTAHELDDYEDYLYAKGAQMVPGMRSNIDEFADVPMSDFSDGTGSHTSDGSGYNNMRDVDLEHSQDIVPGD